MDARLFLGTAHLLRSNGTDEAAYRSAISRAYYACYLVTRKIAYDFCEPEYRKKIGKFITHDKLPQYLKYGTTEVIRQLGEDLAGLLGDRKNADYSMHDKVGMDDAKDAIEIAEAFFSLLDITSKKDIGKAVDNFFKSLS